MKQRDAGIIYDSLGRYQIVRGRPDQIAAQVRSEYPFVLVGQLPGPDERIDPITHAIVPATQMTHDFPATATAGAWIQGTGSAPDQVTIGPVQGLLYGVHETLGPVLIGAELDLGANQVQLDEAGLWRLALWWWGHTQALFDITVSP